GRPPQVKTWEAGVVFYCGDIATHNGSTFQAQRDTCQPTDHTDDWVLLARAGHDGCDGLSPNVCGPFDPRKKYERLDIVEFHGASYIARCDDPGACPGDDDTAWQLLSRGGPRGDTGAVGPRGRKGERGARGESPPVIIDWAVDPVHYRVALTM